MRIVWPCHHLCFTLVLSALLPFSVFAQTDDASPTAPKETLEQVSERMRVKIHGRDVLTKSEIIHRKKEESIPQSLRSDEARKALLNRVTPQFYDHAPTKGSPSAPVMIVEYTDLSCLQCMDILKKTDEVLKQFEDKIYYVHVHLPVDMFLGTNPAAFYGRIANMSGAFWPYRKLAMDAAESTDQVYSNMLLQVGVDKKEMRQLIRRGSRRAYRDLDADSQLAKKMKETAPPVLFVNGVRVGHTIPMESLEELVRYEIIRNERAW